MLQAYRSLKLVIVLYQANNQGGAWRSIMTYFRNAEMNGESVKLIDRSNRRTFRQVAAAAAAAPRLLINGLGSFQRWEAILIGLLRRDAFVYLHETAYMLDRFQQEFPFRYRFLRRILMRNPILAVSEQAAALYRDRFGSKNVSIIYECLPSQPVITAKGEKTRICMVGTIDERKGASFFSRLADLAAERGLPWEFHWIGSKGSREPCYLSTNVTWWGWMDNPREFVKTSDLFFLASVDDPFPLACLEALQDQVRSVAYAGTGVSEILIKIPGCGIFPDYREEDALAAIQSSLATSLDTAALQTLMKDLIEVSAFQKRMDLLLSRPLQRVPSIVEEVVKSA